MTSSCLRLVCIAVLSLYAIQRRNGFVLSTCIDLTADSEDKQPEIIKQLAIVKTGAVSRPQCDKESDELVSQLAKHFVEFTTEPAKLQKRKLGFLTAKKSRMASSPASPTKFGYVKAASAIFEGKINGGLCYMETYKYFEDFLKDKADDEVVNKLRGYQTTLGKLVKMAEKFCTKCSVTNDTEKSKSCPPTCDQQYNKHLEEFYEKVKADRRTISHKWLSAYFLKASCNIQFLVAAEVAAISKDRDEALYTLYFDYVREDAKECLYQIRSSVDYAVLKASVNAAANRAFIYREFSEWLATFEILSMKEGLATGENERQITTKDYFMVGSPSKGWFSCKESDRAGKFCGWVPCRGNVTDYKNNAKPKAWSQCEGEKLRIEKITDYASTGDSIRAKDYVYLLKGDKSYVRWDRRNEKDCLVDRLVYETATEEEVGLKVKGYFTIEAFDWTGRQRGKGEPIRSRDYVYFDFINQPNDLGFSEVPVSVNYIEGFLFIRRPMPLVGKAK